MNIYPICFVFLKIKFVSLQIEYLRYRVRGRSKVFICRHKIVNGIVYGESTYKFVPVLVAVNPDSALQNY